MTGFINYCWSSFISRVVIRSSNSKYILWKYFEHVLSMLMRSLGTNPTDAMRLMTWTKQHWNRWRICWKEMKWGWMRLMKVVILIKRITTWILSQRWVGFHGIGENKTYYYTLIIVFWIHVVLCSILLVCILFFVLQFTLLSVLVYISLLLFCYTLYSILISLSLCCLNFIVILEANAFLF
jgi:hypothetical protein